MRRLLFFLFVCLLLISGCQKQQQEEKPELHFHVAALTGPLTLNPVFVRDSASAEVAALLHTTLLVTDPQTLTPLPRLITSWEYDREKLTYLFTLYPEAVWSDGTPITAEDVAFTMRVLSHPDYTGLLYLPLRYVLGAAEYKAGHASELADGDIAGIRVIDEKTLSVTLKEPYAPFLSLLTFAPLPARYLSAVKVRDLERHEFSLEQPVTSGPYLLAEWNRDEYVHVKANPAYFLGKPALDNLYYRFIPNAETQLIELLAGKLDLVPTAVKVEDVAALRKNPELKVYTNPRLVYDYIAINMKKENSPVSDKRVRSALAMLLDRKEVVDNILLGFADPLYGPLLPLHFACDPTLEKDTVDLAEARRLLVEAGCPQAELRLIFNAGNPVRENVALLFKEQAAKVGLDIRVSLLEWEAFLAAINEGDFDLAILGRGVEADPDLSYHWHSDGPGNTYGYSNKRVDALLEEAAALESPAKRTRLYREAQRLIVEDVPAIFLYARQAVHAATAELSGFIPHPENLFYNVHEWTLAGEGDK
jgi:peptide/nickel transport system substrate-binding protein